MNPARLQLRQGNGEPHAAYWVLTVLTAGRGATRSSFSVSPCQDSHYANVLSVFTPQSDGSDTADHLEPRVMESATDEHVK